MSIPLEDNVSDIIGKAQRGLGISDSQLAEKAGVSAEKIRKLREGDFDETRVERVAPDFETGSARRFANSPSGNWSPETIG